MTEAYQRIHGCDRIVSTPGINLNGECALRRVKGSIADHYVQCALQSKGYHTAHACSV